MAEAESGQSGVELFEGDACTGEAVTNALSAMTFALGRRFVIADGVERWKEADVAPVAAAMASMDSDALTVAFFGREDGRVKVPAALQKAVEKAGGVVATENALKSRALPGWLVKQAAELGFELDQQGAKALIAQVGDRQQRLLRELEKLALEYGEGARLGVEEVQESCASSAERRSWTLADALVAGDEKTATRLLLELRQQGDRLPSLLYQMVRRVREALAIAEALAAGQPPGADPQDAADAVIRRRPPDQRRLQPRRRVLPPSPPAPRRPRGREPRRGWSRAQRGHRRGPGRHRRRPVVARGREGRTAALRERDRPLRKVVGRPGVAIRR